MQQRQAAFAATVALSNGANLIPVTVTEYSSDKETIFSRKSYILSVNGHGEQRRARQPFHRGVSRSVDTSIMSFTTSVGSNVTSVDMIAAPSDSKAILLLDGEILGSGDTQSVDLDVGKNTITLMVVAQDARQKTYTITINRSAVGNGNGAYLITPGSDAAYTGALTDDGLPTMTVKSSVKGFTYFSVTVAAVTGHEGMETAVFIQIRNGQQIAFSFTRANLDTVGIAVAGFNVKPGDVIEVYIVDDVSNTSGSPTIL